MWREDHQASPHGEAHSHFGSRLAGDPEDHEEPKSEEKGPRVPLIFIFFFSLILWQRTTTSSTAWSVLPPQPSMLCPGRARLERSFALRRGFVTFLPSAEEDRRGVLEHVTGRVGMIPSFGLILGDPQDRVLWG